MHSACRTPAAPRVADTSSRTAPGAPARVVAAAAAAVAGAAVLAGCSGSASSMTCEDYLDKSTDDQTEAVQDLMDGKDIDADRMAVAPIQGSLTAFCSVWTGDDAPDDDPTLGDAWDEISGPLEGITGGDGPEAGPSTP